MKIQNEQNRSLRETRQEVEREERRRKEEERRDKQRGGCDGSLFKCSRFNWAYYFTRPGETPAGAREGSGGGGGGREKKRKKGVKKERENIIR